jgi:hypothetical protein
MTAPVSLTRHLAAEYGESGQAAEAVSSDWFGAGPLAIDENRKAVKARFAPGLFSRTVTKPLVAVSFRLWNPMARAARPSCRKSSHD